MDSANKAGRGLSDQNRSIHGRLAHGRSALDRPMVLAVIGLSFLWSSMGSAATMHFRHVVADSASLVASQWHSVVLAGFYALVALAFVLTECRVRRSEGASAASPERSPARPLISPTIPFPFPFPFPFPLPLSLAKRGGILGAVGLAGNLSLVSTSLAGGASLATALTLLGFALTAVYVAGSVVCWMRALTARGAWGAVLVTVAACALSYAAQLVIDLAVGRGMLVYLVLCPICCGICLALVASGPMPGTTAEGRQTVAAGTTGAAETAGAAGAASTADPRPAWRRLPWGRIAPVLALVYLEQALTSLLFQRYTSWPRDNLALTLGAGLAIWGGVLVVMLVMRRRAASSGEAASPGSPAPSGSASSSDDSRSFLVLFAMLLVVYMAALLATVVVPISDGPVVERLLVAAGSSFKTMLWIALLLSACAGTVSPLVAGVAYVLGVLAVPVSRLASLGFSYADPELVAALCSPAAVVALSAGALFVVAACYVLANVRRGGLADGLSVSRETPESQAGDGRPSDRPDGRPDGRTGAGAEGRRERACAELARQAGLSPREEDVLALVCSGYSARHAGEKLGISESTVVSHVTHIYRKAGVSNRQQLVARVAQLEAEPGDVAGTDLR